MQHMNYAILSYVVVCVVVCGVCTGCGVVVCVVCSDCGVVVCVVCIV